MMKEQPHFEHAAPMLVHRPVAFYAGGISNGAFACVPACPDSGVSVAADKQV